MPVKVSESHQVSPFFLLFLIYCIQVGVGILSYERILVESAGNDAWITIIIAGLVMQIILWMMFRLLERGGGDIFAIQKSLFGKWIGGSLSIFIIIYFTTMGLVVLRTYTEIVQVWMFPHISYWQIAGILVVVSYTFIAGGFRTLTGIAFLSLIYTSPLFFTLFFPMPYVHYENLLPILHHSPWALILTTQKMVLNYIGFEIILIIYPFIKEPKKAKKWGYYAVYFSTVLYLLMFIIVYMYYPRGQLIHVLWPTIEMWKIVDLPFMERFEYIGITIWFFTILPNVCLALWAASRGVKRLFHFNQKITVITMIIIIYVVGYFFNSREMIDRLNLYLSNVGFFFLCGYVPFMYILQTIIHRVKKKHVQA
ncbi:MAG: GerAB/ArcD/ProY family transporter [Tuberibacillus sp.]